ncbi:3-oxoacyl-[acyl-carrier protein] reductase [uncultured Candidatus Thioglobus sp.]|nr:3-oxoacyl-[acyl-carrier protein] reductase [uncultured Candidatus Thioglobus sp.]
MSKVKVLTQCLSGVSSLAIASFSAAGDDGNYITAQTLHVNGGMYTV